MRPSEMIVWSAGEHPFRLGIGELRAIEQRSDAGCAVVLMRLLGQSWKADDVINPIRLGLIGAGMPEKDAQKTLDAAFEVSSLYGLAIVAADILRRFIMWETDDAPGEEPAGTPMMTDAPRFPTDGPDGLPTMEPEPQ